MKHKVTQRKMEVDAYAVLRRAVEDGVAYGWTRAHKHTDAPSQDLFQEELVQAIMNEVCEWFKFDDEERR